jgi:hypothetical protein
MFLASDGQVRLDVNLGRVSERAFSWPRLGELGIGPIALGVMVLTAAVMVVAGAAMAAGFFILGINEFSVAGASSLKAVSAMLGSIAGCGAGVWWGTRQETALIHK